MLKTISPRFGFVELKTAGVAQQNNYSVRAVIENLLFDAPGTLSGHLIVNGQKSETPDTDIVALEQRMSEQEKAFQAFVKAYIAKPTGDWTQRVEQYRAELTQTVREALTTMIQKWPFPEQDKAGFLKALDEPEGNWTHIPEEPHCGGITSVNFFDRPL